MERDRITLQTSVDSGVRTVTAATFRRDVLENDRPVAVEFMSYGCGHCRVLEPVLQAVARSLESSESVFRVNVALDADLASAYAIEGTPTLVMFRDAVEVGRAVGPSPTLSAVAEAVTEPFRT